MYISITAFIFCLGFSVLLGYFFAWMYNYRNLHNEPKGKPQRITETISIPMEFTSVEEKDVTAIKRFEQEKTSYETDSANKDAFLKKLLMLFRSRLEKLNGKILSICYWAYSSEGFSLKISNSSCRIRENLFVPKNNRYFSKKEFNWDGIDEVPIDVLQSDEQIIRSMAGVAVSGDGKLRGYITIDNAMENAFDDEVCMELRELANVAEEMLRTLDMNFKLDRENNLLYGILKGISNLFTSASKGNLIINLSKMLQENFRFNRLMIIIPDEKEKWLISEAVGEQKEILKGKSFGIHEKCLLYELLARKASVLNETRISTDPYQRRLYENEPQNLELRSLFAVMPPAQNNSYPLAIVIESKNSRAVSRIDETMLGNIVACAAVKLSYIQGKDDFLQKREEDFTGIDSNGLGELLNYYKMEFYNFKNSDDTDSIGILFLKCMPQREENQAQDFERFLNVLKELKKSWNGRHLAMLGSGEFVFSIKGNISEEVFNTTANLIISNAVNMLIENPLPVKSHIIWLNRNRMKEKEQTLRQSYITLFTVSVMNKFKEMSEAV